MRSFPSFPRRHRENEREETRWASHRGAAFAIRTGVRLAPVLVAIGICVLAVHLLPRSFTGHLWPGRVLLIVASVLAAFLAERLARKALPLAVLLQLTLLFPDKAPSRLKVARGGSKAALERIDTSDSSAAAERILSLLAALTSHDRRTRGHCERVRVYADMLGAELKLPRADQDRLRWAALLHDIGKLEVDPEILNKAAKPSEREWLILRAHPEQGASLAAPLLGWLGQWGSAIEQHHERFDGTGYPHGLAGEDITRAGRMLSVVDAYEVMTAARAYKRAMNPRAAREELARCAGTHFDPVLVRAFLEISLPRMLWTTGPLTFLGQLPFLGRLGQLAQQIPSSAATSTATATVLAASVIGTTATVLPFTDNPAPQIRIAANPGSTLILQHSGEASRTETPTAAGNFPASNPPKNRTTGAPASPFPETVPAPTPSIEPAATPPVPPSPPAPPAPTAPPTTAPTITITSQPSLNLIGPATMTWTVNDPAATVTCALDGGSPTACHGTYTVSGASLSNHTVVITATDAVGNSSSQSVTWTQIL